MKQIIRTSVFAALIALSAALGGCFTSGSVAVKGDGNMTAGSLAYEGPITKIDLSKVGATLNITSEKSGEITYSIDGNLKPLLDIKVNGGVLTITSNNGKMLLGNSAAFNIGTDALREITADSEVKIVGNGTFKADTFRMAINGAAAVNLALDAGSVSVNVNGAGDIDLSGAADKLDIQNNGASAVKARGLVAQDVSATINGVGSVEVYAAKTLDAAVNGVGSVTYWGDPQLSHSASGLASVKKGG